VVWLSKDELIEKLLKENTDLKQLVHSLSNSIDHQTATIEQLNQTIEQLN